VDAVVVEDDMNPLGVRIGLCDQRLNQFQEQQAGLPLAFDVNEPACLEIPRTSKIALLVTSGSQNLFLLAVLGPVRSDLGIDLDVNFIEVQHDLVGSTILDQSPDRPQSTSPKCLLPGVVDNRLGPLERNSRPAQEAGSWPKH
jgi:hypothetical protein